MVVALIVVATAVGEVSTFWWLLAASIAAALAAGLLTFIAARRGEFSSRR